MLSIGNVSGLLSLARVLSVPFMTVGALNQFGFQYFPDFIKGAAWSPLLMVVLTTFCVFLLSEVMFQAILLVDYSLAKLLGFINYQIGMFLILMSASFTSIGLLGFYKPIELAYIEQSALFGFGAYGLYLLDVHYKAKKSMS
ncbi:hypothetical protein ABV436_000408 [Vibrio parahaemolyticus]|uniref:hypothetical protein n=1 Tax=Vibrio parahaemolyticus TaxID=670 RepID=UPI001112EB49|nr:hypothetical protein [Vibrio parahaemolyticus]EJG0971301.1 hypothetical protein [Vibrio parahaemolyticus]EJG1646699.1 hypothetical protein [Vibrio parahaemolyticus]EMA2530692.1 hypothetical protein [Vibrio parahaemolyticus]MBM5015863.1 hypothetical protein [Vibrio parahaemolyticus]MBM5125525.1 hypothetical protein [Vibrio parahaemolyticus]